jgi:hypothetical protein
MRKSSNPRVVNYLAALTFFFKGRVLVFQKSFAPILFALFLGFLLANIFGTFLGALRSLAIWDGFVIFALVLFVELISYATYQVAKRQFTRVLSLQFTEGKPMFWRITNNFKVGLLLGFFVEAFKVGS